jgi:hypothetical protein
MSASTWPGPTDGSDFYFVQAEEPETAVGRIIELVKTRIPRRFGLDPIRDIQVLCPMNRGGVGARSLNIELQAALNPAGASQRLGSWVEPRAQVPVSTACPGALRRSTFLGGSITQERLQQFLATCRPRRHHLLHAIAGGGKHVARREFFGRRFLRRNSPRNMSR